VAELNDQGELVYTLDDAMLAKLRASHAPLRDPVSDEPFRPGDEVVFCSGCFTPQLLSSWRKYQDRCHCWRGVQTMVPYAPFERPSSVSPVTRRSTRRDKSESAFRTRRWLLWIVIPLCMFLAVALVILTTSPPERGSPEPSAVPTATGLEATATPHAAPPVAFNTGAAIQRRPLVPRLKPITAPRHSATPSPLPRPTPSPKPTPSPSPKPTPSPSPKPTPSPRPSPKRTPYLSASSVKRFVPTPSAQRVAYRANAIHGRILPIGKQEAPRATAHAAASGEVPENKDCVTLAFDVTAAARHANGKVYEKVYADATYFDGQSERAFFPYEWEFTNETDPWSDENLRNPDLEIHVPPPPANADVSTYPKLIQLILKHTDEALPAAKVAWVGGLS
jgi:outer membrane biosynthesis protein TonB